MVILRTNKIDKDPWVDDIPLSHKRIGPKSFSGWLMNNGVFVGIARVYVTKREVEIADVYIAPGYRGKVDPESGEKWSWVLMRKILAAIKRRRLTNAGTGTNTNVWLWTTKDNSPAIRLYQNFGFEVTKMPLETRDRLRREHPWLKSQPLVMMVVSL
jgi:ribosomal protein S18 acetylase RimI-like enzyme